MITYSPTVPVQPIRDFLHLLYKPGRADQILKLFFLSSLDQKVFTELPRPTPRFTTVSCCHILLGESSGDQHSSIRKSFTIIFLWVRDANDGRHLTIRYLQ